MTAPTHPSTLREQRAARLLEMVRRFDPNADPTNILLFRQVRRANHLLTHAAEKSLERAGLTWPKFMLLLALHGNESFGTGDGLQPSELSELQGIPRNTVSELLAGLEEEGLISRELHGSDRRKFVIRLTPRGRKTIANNFAPQFQHVSKCFAPFSPEERASLLELLTRLTQSLGELNP